MLISKVLAALALAIFIAWMIADPGYEPAACIASSLVALIGLFLFDKKGKTSSVQHQTVSGGSVGIQANGDVNVGNVRDSRDV